MIIIVVVVVVVVSIILNFPTHMDKSSPTNYRKKQIYIVLPFWEYLIDKLDANLEKSISKFYPLILISFLRIHLR